MQSVFNNLVDDLLGKISGAVERMSISLMGQKLADESLERALHGVSE